MPDEAVTEHTERNVRKILTLPKDDIERSKEARLGDGIMYKAKEWIPFTLR